MNIFEIQEDLQALIDTLEANGGEVDDELLNQFTATSNDFKDKCLSYAEVIQTLNNDLVLIKEEKDRLDKVKKQKEKSIKFLNDTLVAAIERFGTPDKKGKRVIDYGTKKLSIKEIKSVETNDSVVEAIVHNFKEDLQYNYFNGTLDTNSSIDSEAFKDELNHVIFSEDSEKSILDSDLANIYVTTSVTMTIADLMKERGYRFVTNALTTDKKCDFKSSVVKTDIKGLIESGIESNLGKIVINKKVNIK
mgnify:CR=1 FL=1